MALHLLFNLCCVWALFLGLGFKETINQNSNLEEIKFDIKYSWQ